MAADQQADNNWLRMRTTKIQAGKFADGASFLLGVAGTSHKQLELHRHLELQTALGVALENGFPGYKHEDSDTSAILACKGRAWHLSGGAWLALCRPYHAIGSGRDFAIAAMALGQTAHQAVELAIGFDVNSGGGIDCLEA